MAYLEELLPVFRNGAKIRHKHWNEDCYIILKNGRVRINNNEKYDFCEFDFITDGWELYQESIDWKYIIDHKCLCWFWDDEFEMKEVGLLTGVSTDNEYPFEDDKDIGFKNYCPVRRDEVTFYEDRNDE